MSWKMLGLAFAAGMVFATADSRAMPLTHELKAAVSDDVVAVADGCGRGWRWSHGRGACVPMRGYGPRPVVVDPGAVAIGTAAAITLGVVGTRHHHYQRRHHRRHH